MSDLFFLSRIRSDAAQVGADVVFARTGAEALRNIDEQTRLLIVDLAQEAGVAESIQEMRARWPELRILGFYPHVQVELARQARHAGAEWVLPRSKFSEKLPDILSDQFCDPSNQEPAG